MIYDPFKETMLDVFQQQENIIIEQLNNLITEGLIIVELGPATLVQSLHSDKLELKQTVKLIPMHNEYIKQLEAENKTLKEYVELIKKSLTF